MKNVDRIDSFILIGGSSSRYGSPKALIKIDGRLLVLRTAETIKTALPETKTTLVASSADQFPGLGLDMPFIFDLYGGRGPLGGLHAALAYAGTDWIFITACDYPDLSPDLIEYLKNRITDDLDAVVPVQPDGRVQPLMAFYRTKPCLSVTEQFLTSGRATPPLRVIFDSIRTSAVKFEDMVDLPNSGNFFLNLNTPEDARGNR